MTIGEKRKVDMVKSMPQVRLIGKTVCAVFGVKRNRP